MSGNENPNPFLNRLQYFVWVDNGLNFFPAAPSIENYDQYHDRIKIHHIPLENIEYYTQTGELFRETKISGGGGGGSSIEGAIIGGLLFGPAGAIIGSRQKTEGVQSELIAHDSRETILKYFENGNRLTVHFQYTDFDCLFNLIPQKDKSVIDTVTTNQAVSQTALISDADSISAIKALAELKDNGLLSDTEFEEKRQILLDRIK